MLISKRVTHDKMIFTFVSSCSLQKKNTTKTAKMMNVKITVKKVSNLSRKQKRLREVFESAKSVDESLKTLKQMETFFDESDLGMPCWTLAHKLHIQARPEESLVFGNRSLKILLANINNNLPCFGNYSSGIIPYYDAKGVIKNCSVIHNSSFFIACVCNLLGSGCVVLKRYGEGLSYLNWANRNLTKLEEDDEESCCDGKCVINAVLSNQFQLYRAKFSTNKFDEAALHMRKILEAQEKLLDKGCIELGEANMDVCVAYSCALNFREALPFCLKALEIQTKHLGSDSVEVAKTRAKLGWIYNELGEYEKEHELEELSESVLKEVTPDSLIKAGRYEEAIGVLKGVVSRDYIEEEDRALEFVSMAIAFYKLGKFRDAKKHLRTAQRILNKEGLNQIYVAVVLLDMSTLYEKMNDSETTLSLIKRVLATPELPQNLLSRGASRLFSLIPQRKDKEEIPYMLDLVEKLKESFGPEHYEVGCAYGYLGTAYWNSGQRELAVKFMTNGKDIMDATIGPHHVNSLKTSHTLSIFYAKLGSYDLAHEIVEKVVEGFKSLGPSEQELLEEAVIFLNKLKEAVAASTSSSPQSEDDGEHLSEMISKCGISDDEKEIK